MPSEYLARPNASLSLADCTRTELIIPHLHARDTAGILGELSQLLHEQGCVPDALTFYQAASNHELLAGTTSSCGIAFPHARSPGVRKLQFALGRARKPVDWGANRSNPVQLIFLIAVPATDAVTHLKLLCSLAGLGRQPEFVTKLRDAPDRESVMAVLEELR